MNKRDWMRDKRYELRGFHPDWTAEGMQYVLDELWYDAMGQHGDTGDDIDHQPAEEEGIGYYDEWTRQRPH